MKKTALCTTLLLVLLFVLTIVGVCIGSVAIPLSIVVEAVFGTGNGSNASQSSVFIIRNIRLPRVVCAVLAGSALALGGLVFQSVFRNPMADSYILGVSSGASCLIGFNMLLAIGIGNTFAALIGSICTTAMLFATAKGDHNRLLLSGIAVNFLLSALTTLTIYLGRRQLDTVLYWTMGSLSGSSWPRAAILAAVVVLSSFVLMARASVLDILLLDDSTAISSGLDAKVARMLLLAMASALTAVVVSFCGIIGFVGLMSPHFARLMVGAKHRGLIPTSMLLGSVILLLSDILSRSIVAPSELPIGIITSILGAPVFLVLLRRHRNGF